jgi:hypothetical protein
MLVAAFLIPEDNKGTTSVPSRHFRAEHRQYRLVPARLLKLNLNLGTARVQRDFIIVKALVNLTRILIDHEVRQRMYL